ELADLRRNDGAVLAVSPVEAPLVALRIVGAQSETFDVTGCAIEFDRVEFGAAVPHFVADTGAFELYPGVGSPERMQAPLQMKFPRTNQGIEIVLAVARGVLLC